MDEFVKQIKFKNNRKGSQFDLISLSDLLVRKDVMKSLFEFQQIDFYMLLIFTKGQGIHTIDFTDYIYHKGTILCIRKDQIHRFHKANAEGYLLLFTDEFLLKCIESSEVYRSLQIFNNLIVSPKTELNDKKYQEVFTYITEIEKEYFNINDDYSLNIIRNLLHILFGKLLRAKSNESLIIAHKQYFPEFLHFQKLVERQCTKNRKVQVYADEMSISTKTLNKITQRILHKTAKQFIDEIVILQIKRLLINSQLSIKEVAYQSGFDEPTNFYKFFKKNTFTTPELFRKSDL